MQKVGEVAGKEADSIPHVHSEKEVAMQLAS
jgi:hypothetical protein